VATPDSGTRDLLTDDITAKFVPHHDPAAVAVALERLVDDARLRRKLGENLRHVVEREFDTGRLVPRWVALFDEVIAESRSNAASGCRVMPTKEASRHFGRQVGRQRDSSLRSE
jgi:hypothetical protein